MKHEPPESRFDRWWWRAWYVFVALALVWLVWCGWLARPIAPWTQGWVGWWTGDQMGSRPLWKFNVHVGEGADILSSTGNPVFRTADGSTADLGHWGEDEDRWTWAGWVKVTTPTGVWPTNLVVVRTAQSPAFQLRIGFDSGQPKAIMDSQAVKKSGMPWEHTTLAGQESVSLGQWVHLAFSAD